MGVEVFCATRLLNLGAMDTRYYLSPRHHVCIHKPKWVRVMMHCYTLLLLRMEGGKPDDCSLCMEVDL